MRILIANPNTTAAITTSMVEAARALVGGGVTIVGATAPFGAPALETPADLATAELAVAAMLGAHPDCGGAIVGAFGDPGLARARTAFGGKPVRGLGEAGLRAAGAGGRRFAVVTLGPAMRPTIEARVSELGLADRMAGIAFLSGGVLDLANEPWRYHGEILAAVAAARDRGAEAVLLGGAPFSGWSGRLQARAALPLLDGLTATLDGLVPGGAVIGG
ncbi:aspartate/glutamate racemase family protein [Azospirillum endophyticum]